MVGKCFSTKKDKRPITRILSCLGKLKFERLTPQFKLGAETYKISLLKRMIYFFQGYRVVCLELFLLSSDKRP